MCQMMAVVTLGGHYRESEKERLKRWVVRRLHIEDSSCQPFLFPTLCNVRVKWNARWFGGVHC